VSSTVPDLFLEEAVRIGRDVAGGALRSRGQATWLADEIAFADGRWQSIVATLGPDLATGTAGVGWFLARLAATAHDHGLVDVAVAALGHGVERAATLAHAGRLDWYYGASGVAWAAIDGGRALGNAELVATGTDAARTVVKAVRDGREGPRDRALVGGDSGVVAGLLALASICHSDDFLEAAGDRASGLAQTLPDAVEPPGPVAGLARGLSGIGLVLAAAAHATGQPECRDAAGRAFAAERMRFEPGVGWLTPAAHPWLDAPTAPDGSWCRGAAGAGLARLGARAALRDLLLLAEVSAAVEFVRGYLTAPDDSDASLCHGAAGAIELLVSAGALLGEPAHTHAARTAGLALMERSWSRGRYPGACGTHAHNPSLMFGLAGTASVLLRLHDHGAIPSPALPPI